MQYAAWKVCTPPSAVHSQRFCHLQWDASIRHSFFSLSLSTLQRDCNLHNSLVFLFISSNHVPSRGSSIYLLRDVKFAILPHPYPPSRDHNHPSSLKLQRELEICCELNSFIQNDCYFFILYCVICIQLKLFFFHYYLKLHLHSIAYWKLKPAYICTLHCLSIVCILQFLFSSFVPLRCITSCLSALNYMCCFCLFPLQIYILVLVNKD